MEVGWGHLALVQVSDVEAGVVHLERGKDVLLAVVFEACMGDAFDEECGDDVSHVGVGAVCSRRIVHPVFWSV